MMVCSAASADRYDNKCQVNQARAYSTANSIVAPTTHTQLGLLHILLSLLAQALLSALQERRERRALDVEEAAVAAAAAASAQASKHDPAKGQWDFAQRAQRAALAEDQAAAANGVRSNKKGQHQRHGSASDREGPVYRQAAEVTSACHCGHVLQILPQHACCLVNRTQTPIILSDALCLILQTSYKKCLGSRKTCKDAYIAMLHVLVVIFAGNRHKLPMLCMPTCSCLPYLRLLTVCAVV